MKTFYKLLGNSLLVATTNNFVWFALTFWAFLETRSVIATGIVGGTFLVAMAISNMWFGGIVDHNKKKTVLLGSSIATLILFSLGFLFYNVAPEGAFTSVASPYLWVLILILMSGVISGSIYAIAIPTLVPTLVPEDRRDKANGMFGTTMGISFALTSVGSAMVLGYLGMFWVFVIAIAGTLIAITYLILLSVPEPALSKEAQINEEIAPGANLFFIPSDIKGTIKVIKSIPGLFGLIFFTTFNNFLGGVFMALMDAYGLSLVSVQVWGTLWGILSLGFIVGGLYIAKKGLGKNPLKTLFRVNLAIWTTSALFTTQPSLPLLIVGLIIWITLVPFIEATEQTIMQKVVPQERLGRVFGFAHSIEQAASPLTAFLIGPITQLVFIPFMTTGRGVDLIGGWYGTGAGRGMALVFTLTGIIGLIVTFIAMRSKPYKLLTKTYLKN